MTPTDPRAVLLLLAVAEIAWWRGRNKHADGSFFQPDDMRDAAARLPTRAPLRNVLVREMCRIRSQSETVSQIIQPLMARPRRLAILR
jgi:hypothetical protein